MAENQDKSQKTEEATPRRLEEARDKGQVAMSSELMAGVGLCVGAAVLLVAGGVLARTVAHQVVVDIVALRDLGLAELSTPDAAEILRSSVTSVLGVLSLFLVPAALVGAIVGYAQIGFRVTPKAVEMDFSKLDLAKGMGRLVSARSAVRTLMSGAKVCAIGSTVAIIAWLHLDQVVRLSSNELGPLLAGLGRIALRCTAGALVVILLLALVDLAFQRFQHARDMRMTKQEVKEELRLTDGDPHMRARVRQIQREMATRRMMDDVPRATVVVTNPTHYAVALRYEPDEEVSHGAPMVVAKGVDHLAERIKLLATENDVVCYEDVPLARALHAQVEIGQEIPEELYGAVATVLGHVYRLRGRAASA